MAALPRLHMKEIAYKTWKGKTFTQLTSSLIKNKNNGKVSGKIPFLPGPQKIFRKEIASITSDCTPASISIDEFNRPNGYIISNATNLGFPNTIAVSYTHLTLPTNREV